MLTILSAYTIWSPGFPSVQHFLSEGVIGHFLSRICEPAHKHGVHLTVAARSVVTLMCRLMGTMSPSNMTGPSLTWVRQRRLGLENQCLSGNEEHVLEFLQ